MVVSIPLSKTGKNRGKFEAIVDDCDADLAELNWSVAAHKTYQYAHRLPTPNQKVLLHRIILERILGKTLEKGEYPDHIDGNGLNNTRKNLRLATKAQNAMNRRKQSNNTSGYKGVILEKGRWRAQIKTKGKLHFLGYYATPEEAHEAYKKKAIELFGEFANFG